MVVSFAPTSQIEQYSIAYVDPNGQTCVRRLTVATTADCVVAFLTERVHDTGMSITNAAEAAWAVAIEVIGSTPDLMLEHYVRSDGLEESVDEVQFENGDPTWHPLSLDLTLKLVGIPRNPDGDSLALG